jgi:hypothetical protein
VLEHRPNVRLTSCSALSRPLNLKTDPDERYHSSQRDHHPQNRKQTALDLPERAVRGGRSAGRPSRSFMALGLAMPITLRVAVPSGNSASASRKGSGCTPEIEALHASRAYGLIAVVLRTSADAASLEPPRTGPPSAFSSREPVAHRPPGGLGAVHRSRPGIPRRERLVALDQMSWWRLPRDVRQRHSSPSSPRRS